MISNFPTNCAGLRLVVYKNSCPCVYSKLMLSFLYLSKDLFQLTIFLVLESFEMIWQTIMESWAPL